MIFLCVIGLLAVAVSADENDNLRFPDGFKIGVSTSSYQIEGAWNSSDKAVSVWDDFTHRYDSPIHDKTNGDVACDSYNRYKQDLTILNDLGVDFYRMSVSWSHILPTGFSDKVSSDGIRYYKNVLDDLNALGIEPLIVIYHWDHPVVLEEMGGWTNELMVTWFLDYARIVFREFGDRVKIFGTINEPDIACLRAYGEGTKAPGKKLMKTGPYLCVHNMLKAHAKAYKMYDTEFRKTQGGKIGIILSAIHHYPKNDNDTESPEVAMAFDLGWVADPLLAKDGDYPDVMKRRIAENSQLEGYPRSRLPEFTQTEIDEMRGATDYIGLNHYTSVLTESAPKSNNTLWHEDSGVITSQNDSWPHTSVPWLKVVPKGFGDLLRTIKTRYNNPTVYVLENGMADDGNTPNDYRRIQYLHDYMRELLIAVNKDGCNVGAYAVWSFLDSFEWEQGYTQRFGLVNVDFESTSRVRTPKLSYSWLKKMLRSRKLSMDIS